MENMDFEYFSEHNSKAEIDVRYSIMRGKRYRDGDGCQKDLVQADEWFRKAQNLINDVYMDDLYDSLEKKKNGDTAEPKNYNFVDAQTAFEIGELYEFGPSIIRDYKEARSWYMIALKYSDTNEMQETASESMERAKEKDQFPELAVQREQKEINRIKDPHLSYVKYPQVEEYDRLKSLGNKYDYGIKDDMFICMCMSAVALLVLLIMLFVTKMHGLFAAFLALVYGTVLLLTVAHLTDDNIFLSFGLAIIFGLFLFGRKFLIFQLAVLILCLVFSAYRWYREVNYLKCQKQSEEYYQKVIQPLKEKERQELIREFEKKYHKKLYL